MRPYIRGKKAGLDLEAVETTLCSGVHHLGALALEKLLAPPEQFAREIPCPLCARTAYFHQMRPKQLVTMLGPVTVDRPYYRCPGCHNAQSIGNGPRRSRSSAGCRIAGAACGPASLWPN